MILATLPLPEQVAAILTASPEAIRTAYKTQIGARGGRPKLLKPCPKCGAVLGYRDRLKHRC